LRETRAESDLDLDAVIVGAGFSGLYMLHRLRDGLGLKVRLYEADDSWEVATAASELGDKPGDTSRLGS
jgi:cation diffusion facilitator CzcD-associated flavoprotein CzcO